MNNSSLSLKKISLWLAVLGWMGVIFYLSHIPNLNSGLGLWDFVLRKIAHMTEYTVLTWLLARAIEGSWINLSVCKVLVWSIAVSFLYAMSDEYHQSFVVGRFGNAGDVLIDFCGMMLFVLIYFHQRKRAGN